MTSIWAIAARPYLIGERYCIQPSQFGRLALFLKNPENMMKGVRMRGTMAATDLGSCAMLPSSSPSELPHRFIRKFIR